MPPHATTEVATLPPEAIADVPVKPDEYRVQIVWLNVVLYTYNTLAAIYGLYLILTWQIHLYTLIFAMVMGQLGGMLGITAGVHRLWSHRAFKATWPLRLLLAFFQTFAYQNHIFEWARDHRVHHKWTDTNADPHNSLRGFFFCHVGWLLVKKHPDIIEKGKTVDVSDLENDWVVAWQRKLYPILLPTVCYLMPTYVPVYFWGETVWNAWHMNLFRYVISLHFTWLVNSAAHMYGMKPYDSTITPVENMMVSVLTSGEGWHNYHHSFPYDYKASEFGNYGLNTTTAFLDLCGWLGLAYDFRTASPEIVKERILGVGDGSHKLSQMKEVWGWGDQDMSEKEKTLTTVASKRKEK